MVGDQFVNQKTKFRLRVMQRRQRLTRELEQIQGGIVGGGVAVGRQGMPPIPVVDQTSERYSEDQRPNG